MATRFPSGLHAEHMKYPFLLVHAYASGQCLSSSSIRCLFSFSALACFPHSHTVFWISLCFFPFKSPLLPFFIPNPNPALCLFAPIKLPLSVLQHHLQQQQIPFWGTGSKYRPLLCFFYNPTMLFLYTATHLFSCYPPPLFSALCIFLASYPRCISHVKQGLGCVFLSHNLFIRSKEALAYECADQRQQHLIQHFPQPDKATLW